MAIQFTPERTKGFIHSQTAHGGTERDTLLLGDEVALYADAAYSSQETRDKLAMFGSDDQVQRKRYRGSPFVRRQ